MDCKSLTKIFVSPRQRARKTFDLLFSREGSLPPYELTEEVREWDYGDYEGLVTSEIHKLNPSWEIFINGWVTHDGPKALCFCRLPPTAAREVRARKRCVLEWIRWSPRSAAFHGGPIKSGVPYVFSGPWNTPWLSRRRNRRKRCLDCRTRALSLFKMLHPKMARSTTYPWKACVHFN